MKMYILKLISKKKNGFPLIRFEMELNCFYKNFYLFKRNIIITLINDDLMDN